MLPLYTIETPNLRIPLLNSPICLLFVLALKRKNIVIHEFDRDAKGFKAYILLLHCLKGVKT